MSVDPLRLTIALLAALALLGCSQGPRRDNVILISIDTLRADHLGVYGYRRPTSPTIDAMAKDGVLFQRAYSQSPKTAPSHMTILTGLYPEAHGVRNWAEGEGNSRLSPEIPTLASLLQDAGYRTLALTGYGHVHPDLGFDHGFDAFQFGGGNRVFLLGLQALREYRAAQGEDGPPFFLFLHTYAVHDPYTPPGRFARMFTDPSYAGRILSSYRELSARAGQGWQPQHDLFWSRVDPSSPADLRHLTDLYDAGIRFTDRRLRQLLRGLEELGLLETTVVVVLSDHGEEFLEHEHFLHDSLYQEVLHVPLVIRFPGARGAPHRGVRVPGVVRLVDVMPTLLDWLGLEVPAHVQGESLLPLLRRDGGEREPTVLSQWPLLDVAALRRGDLKYIAGQAGPELYDLARDPAEQQNLAVEQPERSHALGRELEHLLSASRRTGRAFAPGISVSLDDGTRARLEALGYLRPGDAEAPSAHPAVR